MRTRRLSQDQVAEVARRRLELLSAELAEIRPGTAIDDVDAVSPGSVAGDGRGSAGDGHGSAGDGRGFAGDDGQAPAAGAVGAQRSAGSTAVLGSGVPGRHAHRSVGVTGSAAGWLEDRLPPGLQGRVRMTTAHLLVVALVAVGGIALTAGWVLRAEGTTTTVPPLAAAPAGSPVGDALVTPSPPSAGLPASPGGASTAGASPGGAAATGASIVVDVTGKVRRPGIATLPPGSRVVDALEAAGGARPGARLGSLNLARPLTDGEQVVVGVPPVPGVAASAASAPAAGGAPATALVNLNTASLSELEILPGVGPVTAQAIVDFRTENGGFTSVDELLEVSGIGDATLAEIAPHATL